MTAIRLLTWNIQSTKGCDGRYDGERIADVIDACADDGGDIDVICLQEVARDIEVYGDSDQRRFFERRYPRHHGVWARSFSTPRPDGSRRAEFGVLTLARRSLLADARTHFLPWPAHDQPQFPRVAAEAVVRAGDRHVAVLNAHLAYHSAPERALQMQALTAIRDRILARGRAADLRQGEGAYRQPPRSETVLLCGDLNIDLQAAEYRQLITERQWADCWNARAGRGGDGAPRPPSCGCYDRVLWPQGPHVRDYFLLAGAADAAVTSFAVDTDTDASDHQPMLMTLRTAATG